jgi:hypothetical protein
MQAESVATVVRVPFARGVVVINDVEKARQILTTEDDYVRGACATTRPNLRFVCLL